MKRVLTFLLSFAILFSAVSTANSADVSSSDPVQLMEKAKPASGARGIVFVENAASMNPIGLIKYSHIPTFKSNGSIEPSDYWSWKKCSSWNDQNCPIKDGYQLEGRVFLGPCLDALELGCIESFKIFNSFGAGKKISFVEKYNGVSIDTPQDSNLGIPRSSSPSIYKDEEGNLYVVRAVLYATIIGNSLPLYKFDADVTPVTKALDSSLGVPRVENSTDPRTGLSNVGVTSTRLGCLATDIGVCFKASFSEREDKYSLSVRMPKTVSGWLRGRVADATFDVQSLNEKSQIVSVTAKSVRMPIAGGWVKYSQLPAGFIETVWPSGGYDPNPNSSYFLMADPSQGNRGLEEYEAWSPYLNEKALTSITTWSFGTNMSSADQSCLKVPGEISGFVASNASVYSSKPPQWDPSTSSLTYKVAAPHLDESGIANVGNYTLAMPLTSIKCLYGRSNLPPSATVSVAYGNEVTNIATVSLQSDSGWVFFSANNFHYSSPNIVVKFNSADSAVPLTPSETKSPTPAPAVSQSPSAKPSPEATPSPSVSPSATAKPQPTATKTTIWCAKGYAKRKVTAIKPVCPKGYKKIADPFSR